MRKRGHPFSTSPPTLDLESPGKSSVETKLPFEEEMQLRSGKPQRQALVFINTLLQAGKPLSDLKEYYMQSLGYDARYPDHVMRFEDLLVDKFAMALSFEHEDVPQILSFMEENEADIFPDGLENYEIFKRADAFYEKGQHSAGYAPLDTTHSADGSLRDLVLIDKYLKPLWDEHVPFIIHDGKYDVVAQLAEKKLVSTDTLIYNLLPFSGEMATKMRLAILGSDTVTAFEADERLSQVMILAFPPLVQKMHLVGSIENSRHLLDIHLPELAKAESYLSTWAIHQVAKIVSTLKGLEQDWTSTRKEGAQTKAVFEFLRQFIPSFHKHMGHLLCERDVGIVAQDQYTETSFAADFFKQICKRCKQNKDGAYQLGNGTGHFHNYVAILETVDKGSLDNLHERLSADELLLAYQLTRHNPLLKHLSAAQRDVAFGGELGL
ncbi:hypothetical protein [Pseudomonas viridiflava]|uniref:hypothetical protein n=1 Tax=Pseudomonas viridiflava TaxID=33069 RepID=UPI001F146E5B|nr:hypothetical protein [Pseudomonas viridiflava]